MPAETTSARRTDVRPASRPRGGPPTTWPMALAWLSSESTVARTLESTWRLSQAASTGAVITRAADLSHSATSASPRGGESDAEHPDHLESDEPRQQAMRVCHGEASRPEPVDQHRRCQADHDADEGEPGEPERQVSCADHRCQGVGLDEMELPETVERLLRKSDHQHRSGPRDASWPAEVRHVPSRP
jgi:hypothetical protein